ncbi:MAG: AAA family ATPase [Sideroxydans sp.]|nr:AAA family ATPase [Sideroxydans sp.]
MKIENLSISNFRGIGDVRLSDLGTIIIVAGQNGSGKSCIFDAIRLLKSVYGGYQANEWQQWMGEFQINLTSRSSDFVSMFNDRSRELRIRCDFRLAEEERQYITTHANELLREKIWRAILPEAYSWGGHQMAVFAAQFRDREPEVAERVKVELPLLMKELAAQTIRGECFVLPGGPLQLINSMALSVAFSTFRPTEIGVIDYHGAQRHYGRESVQGINLNLEASEQQRSQSALYNYGAKYSNVKGEMAASFVKELLATHAGVNHTQTATLSSTLQELFATFFPEKKFLGPKATTSGALSFPVETLSGAIHDLDELSAGEKEILYGYLRIRNSAPKNSIILLDEPELHLNPRLIRGLPQFYKKNLGEALGNQIWLVSHSDALLREVVGRAGYNVFHMLPCGKVGKGESQLKPLSVTADLDLAIVDLVGDLASYRPNGKVVIFEGGGDSDFDQRVVATLFPDLVEHANLVSGSNKTRVRALHETLDAASKKGQLPFKFYAITDRDSDQKASAATSVNMFSWDVYHIENYLLAPEFILKVMAALGGAVMDEKMILDELRNCAESSIPQLVRHDLAVYANNALVAAVDTATNPKALNVSAELHNAASRSFERIKTAYETQLSEVSLQRLESESKTKYLTSVADGTWVEKIRGRDILKMFVSKHANTVSYEIFRNLIISMMKDASYQPTGMRKVIDKILAT